MKKPVAILALLSLGACATSPANISASYISPIQYSGYSCDQIRMELGRVSDRVREVTGQQQNKANNDKIAMGVGLVIFWPALFFMMGGDHKEELASLKGQYDALSTAGNLNNCFKAGPTLAAAVAPSPNPASPNQPAASLTPVSASTPSSEKRPAPSQQ